MGWACGVGGKIIYTVDGGQNWTEQTSGTEENLFDIDFVDESNGWAVGTFGANFKHK